MLGWAASIVYWSLLRTLVADGSARHAWDVPLSIFTASYVKRLLVQQIFVNFAMWAVKACILALFIRIFNSVRWLRITSYVLIVFLTCFHLSIIILWIALCIPRGRSHWGVDSLAQATTRRVENVVVLVGVEGFLVDCIIFVLPFPSIIGLQMRKRRKVMLVLVFAVALWYVSLHLTLL